MLFFKIKICILKIKADSERVHSILMCPSVHLYISHHCCTSPRVTNWVFCAWGSDCLNSFKSALPPPPQPPAGRQCLWSCLMHGSSFSFWPVVGSVPAWVLLSQFEVRAAGGRADFSCGGQMCCFFDAGPWALKPLPSDSHFHCRLGSTGVNPSVTQPSSLPSS